MTATPIAKSYTLIDALKASFEAALRSPEGIAEPAALLWIDSDRQWAPIIPDLQNCIAELYVLGSYNPTKRIGPAIWLKCIVDRTLPEVQPKEGVPPILYLPGVSRQELRAGGDCPSVLQPLIELQYRGAVWHQRNGRDWTVESFLVSESGLGLDISQDSRTRESLLRAIAIMAKEPIEHFRDRRLDAQDFDKLSVSDPVRDVLLWMNDPSQFERACESSRWQTFRDVALREFGFDPGNNLPNEAAGAIVKGGGKWEDVWVRFSEAPHLYPGVTVLLRSPERYIPIHLSRSPVYNEEQEHKLRHELMSCAEFAHSKCCEAILSLEQQHSERRSWVWARIGESPLITSLEPLSRLASLAKSSIGGNSIPQFVEHFTTTGWQCDSAAVEALSTNLSANDFALVSKLIRALYEPWLDQTTRHFQALLLDERKSSSKTSNGVSAQKDTCILFVDGLRFDVSQQLIKVLAGRGFSVNNGHRLAPLPTVTATAKPLCCPAHTQCKGGTQDSEFTPQLISGQPATIRRLRDEMTRLGVEIIEPSETGNPTNSVLGGWTEIGRLDELGHKLGTRMARQIQFELDVISDRIATLLAAGWRRVHVVTDHGWLLLPGGLPKVHVPPHLVETKWSRCAVISGHPELSVPTFSWYWNEDVKMACPPGIGSFLADNEYSHGGISPQECVIPDLWIELAEQPSRSKIMSVAWRGMRCRVITEGMTSKQPLLVDIRLSWRNKDSSISASSKEIGESGEASIVVSDDKHEGAAAAVVLMDSSGNVIDYQPTTVGEDEK